MRQLNIIDEAITISKLLLGLQVLLDRPATTFGFRLTALFFHGIPDSVPTPQRLRSSLILSDIP